MINKGMANKGKYWILEKNKGTQISKEIKVLIRVTSAQ